MFARPINVCHLGKYYPPAPGGIESHVRTLALAQAALGARVRVVCVNHRDREGRDVTWSRYGATKTVEEHDHDVHVTRLGRSACLARLDVIPGLFPMLSRIQYSNADIVHLHCPNPTMLVALSCLRLNKPVVVTHHSDIVSQRFLVHAMRPLERIVYGRAAALLASSEPYIDGSDVLRSHRDKVQTLPLGVELSPFVSPSQGALAAETKLRAEIGEGPLWLSVGRCVAYKGFHTGVDALRRTPGKWLIIGSGPMLEPLKLRAKELGVIDRLIFRGYVSDDELAGAYRAATALWFPSCMRSEGFGLVQVEAMASGCPVINTRIFGSGVAWVSPHEQTGLTFEIGSADGLARASKRLLDEPGLRDRFSAAARARALAEFSAETMGQRSLEIYARLLQRAQLGGRVIDAVPQVETRLDSWVRNSSSRVYNSSGTVDVEQFDSEEQCAAAPR
ncbi:MAG TPA: glycosyltransferase [Tepidisphaeraceae bacterium]|nr:glycosyltransferase [Tepidisphaeraceae bacterium]